ncbi:MAG: GNAT family N-acetyltransferase [Lachnospiraceae bacterium]|jgi:hypothetical protein
MKIIHARKAHLKDIKKLYLSAFPVQERKPFWIIKNRAQQGTMEILRLEKNGFAGLAITVLYQDYVLLDYFAIDASRRGEGLGTEAIRLLQKRYADKKFFLEIEAPDPTAANQAQRVSRKNFYLRNGLVYQNLTVKVYGVVMEILTTGFSLSASSYLEIYERGISPMIAKTICIFSDPEDSK